MKRITSVALVLAMCLGLASFAGAESDYRIDTLAAIIGNAFDDSEYLYTYDEDEATITTSFTLDSTLGGTDILIYLYQDGFLIKACSPIYAASAYLELTSEYLGRANTSLIAGDFEMDYETGEIWFKVYQIAADSFPGYGDVMAALEASINALEVYGDGLAKVALTGYDPASAVAEAEGAN